MIHERRKRSARSVSTSPLKLSYCWYRQLPAAAFIPSFVPSFPAAASLSHLSSTYLAVRSPLPYQSLLLPTNQQRSPVRFCARLPILNPTSTISISPFLHPPSLWIFSGYLELRSSSFPLFPSRIDNRFLPEEGKRGPLSLPFLPRSTFTQPFQIQLPGRFTNCRRVITRSGNLFIAIFFLWFASSKSIRSFHPRLLHIPWNSTDRVDFPPCFLSLSRATHNLFPPYCSRQWLAKTGQCLLTARSLASVIPSYLSENMLTLIPSGVVICMPLLCFNLVRILYVWRNRSQMNDVDSLTSSELYCYLPIFSLLS